MGKTVYPVLIAEAKKRQISKKDIAKCGNLCYKAFYNRLVGKVSFTWDEVSKIRNKLFPDMDYDMLFSIDVPHNSERG